MEEEGAEELSKSEQEWYDYFRALFPKVHARTKAHTYGMEKNHNPDYIV